MGAQISHRDLVEAIGEQTLHITDRTKLAKSIAAYMVHENKQFDLSSLTRDIMQYRLEHGIIEAIAVSAHELNSKVLDDIKALLREHFPHAKKVLLDTRLDESVVGGIRIELARERLDLTVQAKLNTFKRLTSPERN